MIFYYIRYRWKKYIPHMFLVLLALIIGIAVLFGGKGTTVTQTAEEGDVLAQTIEIPEDGIITQEDISSIAGQTGTWYFTGQTDDGINYTWAYDGSTIEEAKEQNLKLSFDSENMAAIKLAADNAPYAIGIEIPEMDMIAEPSLKITLNEEWTDANLAYYCIYQDGELYKLSDATVTETEADGTAHTEISITKVPKAGATFYIVAGNDGTTLSETGINDTYSSGTGTGLTDGLTNQTQPGSSTTGTDANTDSVNTSSGSGSGTSGTSSGTGNSSTGTSSGSGTTQPADNTSGTSGSTTGDNSQSSSSTGGTASTTSGSSQLSCTISIECTTILDNMNQLDSSKEGYVPSDGIILKSTKVIFAQGDTVFDVLKAACNSLGITMESSYTPSMNSYYIESINQLAEKDCGANSGWMYKVNGYIPNKGCSDYELSDGDVIVWQYTCDLGDDL